MKIFVERLRKSRTSTQHTVSRRLRLELLEERLLLWGTERSHPALGNQEYLHQAITAKALGFLESSIEI